MKLLSDSVTIVNFLFFLKVNEAIYYSSDFYIEPFMFSPLLFKRSIAEKLPELILLDLAS